MRCPDCSKFVGLDMGDAEVDIDIDEEGHISGTIRIVRTCAECGQEMKEANFDVEAEVPEKIVKAHTGDAHSLSVEHDDAVVDESGGGRYAKNIIRFTLPYDVRCSCQKKGAEPLCSGNLEDEIAASQMDELV